MADIINLADRRKQLDIQPPTIKQLTEKCIDEISHNWEKFARGNRLNDYFMQSVFNWTSPGIDYLSDINALSQIELKINLTLALLAPGAAGKSQLGWIAGFTINSNRIETPFMLSEAYARCFNILLFLKLRRELTQHGIIIEQI